MAIHHNIHQKNTIPRKTIPLKITVIIPSLHKHPTQQRDTVHTSTQLYSLLLHKYHMCII